MKKTLCIILCIACFLALCCCGGDGDAPPASSGDAVSGESRIDTLFRQAEEVYSWFTGCNKPSFSSSEAVESDGLVYVLVTEPGLTDTDELRARLGELFTESIVNSLLDKKVYADAPMFCDINGKLYFCSSASGQVPWDIGQRTGSVISQTDTEIIYHLELTHDYYSAAFTASCDYRLVLCEDGQWRFASFSLPALLIAEQMFLSDFE